MLPEEPFEGNCLLKSTIAFGRMRHFANMQDSSRIDLPISSR